MKEQTFAVGRVTERIDIHCGEGEGGRLIESTFSDGGEGN